MKMILSIVQEDNYDNLVSALLSKDFRVTCIASTGGFLKKGNKTLLIGTQDQRIEEAMELIRANCVHLSTGNDPHTISFVLDVNQSVHF